MRRVLVALSFLFLSLPGFSGVSYSKLTDPAIERAFYASQGKDHRGDRVHLHVKASTLLGDPESEVKTPRGGRLLRFRNKSVPLIVAPGNTYYRKILQRTDRGDRICVKGEVRADPGAAGDRLAIWVHTLKTAPASSKAKSKPPGAKTKRGAGR